MNLAEVWGWRRDGSNPVRHIKPFKESEGAERFLSPAELRALGEGLRAYEADGGSPYAAAAIRFLALTGARKGFYHRDRAGLPWHQRHGAGTCV